MIPSVTVSHPHGNPNSYHTAKAFADADLLRVFERGFANVGFASKLLAKWPALRENLQREIEEPGNESHRQHLVWEAISHVGKRLDAIGPSRTISWYDVLFCGHDWQVSKALRKGTSAVYAYEDGARDTFRAAKRASAITIYELPAGYYAGVARELDRVGDQSPQLLSNIKSEPRWKLRRKDDELGMADLIVVPCEWAAESVRLSDVNSKTPVIKIPYGTPSGEVLPRSKRPDGPFTVLFAGQSSPRKGVTYLLDAWSQLQLKDARLWFAGGIPRDREFLNRHASKFEHFGMIPRRRLLELMKAADLFVLPSVAEGFGLVIGEAMAAGVPVLTTTNTGGPELITDGREGWCIAAHDVELLMKHIEWAYLHRDELFQMGQLATQRAAEWTWADYRRCLVEKLRPFLNGGTSACFTTPER